ncbi:DUF2334 domain-containing protein [Bacillus pumilus]|uniref:DUF2334 domain-containing protein n=1 Tax=Bacillus pumilus (strain SAFR-032) TaxID=315750 RepID=A8FA31_BACP2|nr:DUF2334 domain-containing protein [Bacillus pumilus]ABV61098.1 hypothetical protein BPUM_0403 [Bacillus pumilus SAFR-032]AVI39923.1 DUF2334 domain-containing protein [Bacillus pumilus]MBC3644304.1 DUF2334 domain-containing protein [Bacillus pumilus]MBC3647907.1 DUF2334 domain-containing protein [Bacillus pumilus]MBC3651155.1 DUF2334 domain-containing protein [Bacillus pumilus]
MNCNSLMKCCLMITLFTIVSFKHIASADALVTQPNTLIVYSTPSGEVTPAVHMLDLLVGHFSKQTMIVSDEHLAEKRINEFQQVIYLGEIKRTLSKQTIRAMNESQQFIAIGYNAEQFRPFSKLTFHKQDHTSQIKHTHDQTYRQLERSINVLTVRGAELKNEFLVKKRQSDLPFVIQTKEGAAYIGILDVMQHNELLAEALEKHMSPSVQMTTKYLMLGNISPASDEKKLLELGQYVSAQHIPYQIAVTPAWIDRATGDEVTLSDRPKLVSVLKQLQGNGASIILHGFSRTYRTEESGQGFEFWDAKYDQPISSNDPKKAEKKRMKSQFPNEKDFHTYTKSYQEQEIAYTEEKLTKGIELLTSQGLYPLGFEVPHDATSQQGYEVISKHVSSLFGQVQLSDRTWKSVGASPLVTSPAMLHGMTLYPQHQVEQAPDQEGSNVLTEQTIQSVQHLQSAAIGLSYDVELGIAGLQDLITQMEAIPSSEWLDIKKTKQTVQTAHVKIQTFGNGHIQVEESNIAETKTVKRSGMENMLRILTVVVMLFIAAFALYTLYLRLTMKKRIFKERKLGG